MDYVYCGKKVGWQPSSEKVWANGKPMTPEMPIGKMVVNGAAFGWGYLGARSLSLALFLLCHALKSTVAAARYHRQFAADVVRGWGNEWVITGQEIRAWYATATLDKNIEEDDDAKTPVHSD